MQFLIDNIGLVLLAVVSGGMLLWPPLRKAMLGVREVDAPEAVLLINQKDALLLDVREDSEYEAAHIPGAKHVPLGRIGERLRELEKHKGKPVVVLCRSGNRSLAACAALKRQGFAEVLSLRGGIEGWQQASLPVKRK